MNINDKRVIPCVKHEAARVVRNSYLRTPRKYRRRMQRASARRMKVVMRVSTANKARAAEKERLDRLMDMGRRRG